MRTLITLLALHITAAAASGIPQHVAPRPLTDEDHVTQRPGAPVNEMNERVVIFSEDFANGLAGNNGVGAWTTGGPHGAIWRRKVTGPSGAFTQTNERIQSATVSNGYMLFNSDSANCTWNGSNATQLPTDQFTEWEGSLESPLLDLGATPFVQLRFQQRARYCCGTAPYLVEVSTDGGLSWPHSITISAGNANELSPTETRAVNLSAFIATDPTNVKFRFRHSGDAGTSHYHWQIDDVELVEQPQYDLKLEYGHLSNVTNGNEYGRIPLSQLAENTLVTGGGLSNVGANAHTNVLLQADLYDGNGQWLMVASAEHAEFAFADTIDIRIPVVLETPQPGTYEVRFKVTSDQEQLDDEFGSNNTVPYRRYELTEHVYSLDGLGIHPTGQQVQSSLGTNSFANNADGAIFMTQYVITTPMTITGLEVALASGTATGGQVHAAIFDSASIFIGFPADLTPHLADPLAEANDFHTITQADLSAGRIVIPLHGPVELQPGVYYATIELFGGGTSDQIRIRDDETVPQPTWASLVYLPNSTGEGADENRIWSNGNAFAIRMLSDPAVGVIGSLADPPAQVHPNPTNGPVVLEFETDGAGPLVVEVHDMRGKLVMSFNERVGRSGGQRTTFDVSLLENGVYTYTVRSGDKRVTGRFMVMK